MLGSDPSGSRGPTRSALRRLRRMATRYPRLASAAKRVIRRARPRAGARSQRRRDERTGGQLVVSAGTVEALQAALPPGREPLPRNIVRAAQDDHAKTPDQPSRRGSRGTRTVARRRSPRPPQVAPPSCSELALNSRSVPPGFENSHSRTTIGIEIPQNLQTEA